MRARDLVEGIAAAVATLLFAVVVGAELGGCASTEVDPITAAKRQAKHRLVIDCNRHIVYEHSRSAMFTLAGAESYCHRYANARMAGRNVRMCPYGH